jgi:glycerol kinase
MSDGLVLSIDQGTTGTTALVFDRGGGVRGRGYSEFTQHYPRPGRVEHDAEEIWRVSLGAARDALSSADADARELSAVGVTNQRETVVAWERDTGRPVARAIVWQDRRTAARCDELKARGVEELIRARTGLVLDPYFSGTKFEWLLDNTEGLRARAERGEVAFGTVDSWLVWKLTGGRVHSTDVSNASRTLLFDINRLQWDEELLALFRVPRRALPEVSPSSFVLGHTEPAEFFGARVAVAGVAGDQQAALFGQGCYEPGMVKNTYGTGSFLLANTGRAPVRSHAGLLTTVAWQLEASPRSTRSKAPSSSRARPCSGYATALGLSRAPKRPRRSRARSTRTRASTSCPRSRASARPTGTLTRAAQSSA